MALFGGNDQELRVTIKARDDASKDIAKVQTSIGRLAGGFAVGTIAVDALRTGFRFLSGTITESIARHEKHAETQNRLIHIFKQSTDASDDSIRSLLAQAEALDKVGVVSEEAIMAAQGTLATFDLQAESVERLIPAFLDMVVAERGVNATTEDMIGLANGLGKVLQGQTGALSKQGFIFNEYQAELLKTGTETQKVATLTEILSSTYGGLNRSQRESAGSMYTLRQNTEDLKKDIGSGLVPALNNLFGAFEDTTAGMGRVANVGKVVFRTFASIGEFAAATAAGIHVVAGSIVALSSYALQAQAKLSGVSTVMKWFGKDTDQFFTDFREGTKENISLTSDFYMNLKDRNDSVLASWDDLNMEAKVLGKAGPAAYQATAKEAEAAAKKIDQTRRAIQTTRMELDDFRKSLEGDTQNLATAFVEQEQKVAKIQKELADEEAKTGTDRNNNRIQELKGDLFREHGALEGARTIESQLGPQTAEARRRAGLTDFSREVEDIMSRSIAKREEFGQQIVLNVNFNDAVAGDEGIARIIRQTVQQLNRDTTLSLVAGR